MTPPKRLTDPSFHYTSSADTDIRKLFNRVREQQREAREREQAKVRPIMPVKAKA